MSQPIDIDLERYGETPAFAEGYSCHVRMMRKEIPLDLFPNKYPQGSDEFYAFNVGWNKAGDDSDTF